MPGGKLSGLVKATQALVLGLGASSVKVHCPAVSAEKSQFPLLFSYLQCCKWKDSEPSRIKGALLRIKKGTQELIDFGPKKNWLWRKSTYTDIPKKELHRQHLFQNQLDDISTQLSTVPGLRLLLVAYIFKFLQAELNRSQPWPLHMVPTSLLSRDLINQ